MEKMRHCLDELKKENEALKKHRRDHSKEIVEEEHLEKKLHSARDEVLALNRRLKEKDDQIDSCEKQIQTLQEELHLSK